MLLQLSLLRINNSGRPVSIGDITTTVESILDVVRPSKLSATFFCKFEQRNTQPDIFCLS